MNPRLNTFIIIVLNIFVLLLCILLWDTATIGSCLKALDMEISILTNKTLGDNYWTYFWGILNKKFENYLNQVLILSVITYYCIKSDQKISIILRTIVIYLYCALGVFTLNQLVVDRESPSLVINSFVNISEVLHDSTIKFASYKSFPSGHAFAMICWAIFATKVFTKGISRPIWIIAIFFCLPRLMSGAHWMSDIIGAGLIANIYVHIICMIHGAYRYKII